MSTSSPVRMTSLHGAVSTTTGAIRPCEASTIFIPVSAFLQPIAQVVCEAVRDTLEYVGANLNDVVRTVTYVLDIDAYYAVAEERYKYFASSLPTNTLIAVSRLAHPDMLVEIEAEAIVDPGRLRNLKSYS